MTDIATDALLREIKTDSRGLVAAVARQFDSGEILMLAWMNAESISETLKTGHVCYWSRSRQRLWRKGESSGQTQYLREIRLDCDGDTLLLDVDQKGPACHTGRRSCFYRRWDAERCEWQTESEPMIDPAELYSG